MDKKLSTATQARPRSKNPKHHEPVSPSQTAYVRNVLMVWSRDAGVSCFTNDDEGHRFLIVAISLDLPKRKIEQLTPWRKEVTPQTWQRIEQAAAQFVPTPINIGMFLNLTNAKRDELAERTNFKGKRSLRAILQIVPCDVPDWDAELRRRAAKVKQRRRSSDQAKLTAQIAKAGYLPRDAAVLSAIERIRQRPGIFVAYVPTIMRAMTKTERAAFPHSDASYRRIVRRTVERLERRGLVSQAENGLIFPENMGHPFIPIPPAKPLIGRENVGTLYVRRRRERTTDDNGHGNADRRQDQTLTTNHVDQHPADEGRHGQEADLRHEQTAMSDDTFTAEQRAPSKDARRLRRRVPVVLYDDGGMAMTERTKRNGSNR